MRRLFSSISLWGVVCITSLFINFTIVVSADGKFCEKSQFCPSISHSKSKVYGPGLKVDFTVPVRYFFVNFVDAENRSVAADAARLSVDISGKDEKCRIWTQVLDIKDGRFIVRYRIYETCHGLNIHINYDGKSVAESPYTVEGTLLHEKCYCPKPLAEWMKSLKCPSTYQQIRDDLKIFSDIDMEKVLKDARKRFNQPGAYSICHYIVVSNNVHRKCYGQYVGFSMFMDEILLSLARKVELPDVEMIVNLGDWPLERRPLSQNPIPIFSWCGSKETKDIVMPTYDITEATLEMMGRVMLDMLSVMGNSEPEWEQKHKVAFWRGRDSRQERLDLVKIARKYPAMINASLTNFFFFRNAEAEYGPKAEYVSFFDFFKYRYQINIDGTVAAYRLPYLLGGGSLVLKQESEFYEHFYNALSPLVHYLPFHRNLSNLIEQIEWAMSHDEQAQKIAQNAQEFALNNLLPKDIMCYYAVLLNEYKNLLKTQPKVREGMELVKQPDSENCHCSQEQVNHLKDEL